MNNLIKRLSVNTEGRDFVCGDIHGSYSCVTNFLDKIKFDFNKDRLICAGDLVDRGPENEKCLSLLEHPWFHAVKGNHEDLMDEYYSGGHYGHWWAPNGGRWGIPYKSRTDDEAKKVHAGVRRIRELPYLLTVEKRDGSVFHVIHAELGPSKVPISDADLANPAKFASIAMRQTSDGIVAIWGRYLFMPLYKKNLTSEFVDEVLSDAIDGGANVAFGPGLGMIYSGHTPVQMPVQLFGQTNLDTLAYSSYGSNHGWEALTVTEPETGKFWKVTENGFWAVLPVVIK